MTTSLDDQYTPQLNDAQLDTIDQPAGFIRKDGNKVGVAKLPSAYNVRSKHDAVLETAVEKYRRMLRRVAYPYGVDPYSTSMFAAPPVLRDGTPVSDLPAKPPKDLQKAVWKKAYKKSYKKIFGEKPPKGSMPSKPSFKKLRGSGVYGMIGSGIYGRSACARGGSVIATVGALAAPLILKGLTTLAPMAIKGIKKLIDKRRAKKKAKKEKAAADAAAAATTESEPITAIEDRQDSVAAQGAGDVPTPYQMEQAKKMADKASSRGGVGFPNPLSFPKYPPSLMDPNVPMDALSFWREVYNRVKQGILTMAEALDMPPKYAVPYADRFIRAHAQSVFGSGGAKMLLNTSVKGKPLKVYTPFKLIYPVLQHSVNSPSQREALYNFLKKGSMNEPIKGEGISDIISALGNLTGSQYGDIAIKSIGNIGGNIASYLVDTLKDALPSLFRNDYTWLEHISRLMADIVGPTGDGIMGRGQGIMGRGQGIIARGSSEDGAKLTAAGSGIWDMLKTAGLLAGEVGAPLIGSIAGTLGSAALKKLAKTYPDSNILKVLNELSGKPLKKALSLSGEAAGEAFGDARLIEQVKQAQLESMSELDKKKAELELAASKAPEYLSQLKREAEIGRLLMAEREGKKTGLDFGKLKFDEPKHPKSFETDLIALLSKRGKSKKSSYEGADFGKLMSKKDKSKKKKKVDKVAKYEKRLKKAQEKARKKAAMKEEDIHEPSSGKGVEEVAELKRPPMDAFKYKPAKNVYLSVGPTTADMGRRFQRAGQVLMLAKKIE